MAERDINIPDYSKEGVSKATSLLQACIESNSRERENASFQQRTNLLVKEGLLPELSIGSTGDQKGNAITSGISFARRQESYLQAEMEFQGCEDGGRAVLYGMKERLGQPLEANENAYLYAVREFQGINDGGRAVHYGMKQRLGQPLEANENAYLYAVREFQGINDGGRAVSYSTRERLGQVLGPEEKAYLTDAERSVHPSSSSANLPRPGEKSTFGERLQGLSDFDDPRQSPPIQQFQIDPNLSVQDRNGQTPEQSNQFGLRGRDYQHSERRKPVVLEVPSLNL